MKRLNIGVDVDGVLSNFGWAARKLLKQMYNGQPDDSLVQTTWAFESLGISREQEKAFWMVVDNTPNWWMTHEPIANSHSIATVAKEHRVVFITNRKDGNVGLPIEVQTAKWLYATYGIENPMVVISDNKAPVAQGLKLDYYIDDRPKNVDEVCRVVSKTALLDTTYNRDYAYRWRVKSFNDFACAIKEGWHMEVSYPLERCIA